MFLRIVSIGSIAAVTALCVWSQLAVEREWQPMPESFNWLGMMALGSGAWNVLGQPELVDTPFQTALLVLAGLTITGLGFLAARLCWRLRERSLVPFMAATVAMGLANLVANWAISIDVLVTQWGRPPVAGPDGTLTFGGGLVWPAIIGPLLVVIVNALFLWFWSRQRKAPGIRSG